jgi:hypothetical protein
LLLTAGNRFDYEPLDCARKKVSRFRSPLAGCGQTLPGWFWEGHDF